MSDIILFARHECAELWLDRKELPLGAKTNLLTRGSIMPVTKKAAFAYRNCQSVSLFATGLPLPAALYSYWAQAVPFAATGINYFLSWSAPGNAQAVVVAVT